MGDRLDKKTVDEAIANSVCFPGLDTLLIVNNEDQRNEAYGYLFSTLMKLKHCVYCENDHTIILPTYDSTIQVAIPSKDADIIQTSNNWSCFADSDFLDLQELEFFLKPIITTKP